MGRATFFHIIDSRSRLQVYLREDKAGEKNYQLFSLIDIGDIVSVEGVLFKTRTGELSVSWQGPDGQLYKCRFLRVFGEMSTSPPGKMAWTAGCGDSLSQEVPGLDHESGPKGGVQAQERDDRLHEKVFR